MPQEGLSGKTLFGLAVAGNSLLAVSGQGTILQSASVAMPPQFRPWATQRQPDGSVALTLDAPPGSILSIETSLDLKAWSPLQVVTNLTPRVDIVDTGGKGMATRFYRAWTR